MVQGDRIVGQRIKSLKVKRHVAGGREGMANDDSRETVRIRVGLGLALV